MAKRFTETDKWKDKWFRALSPTYKMAWLYLLDNCDVAGVIDVDEELANFQIGEEVDWQDFVDVCGETRISRLKNGKLHLVRFIEYQYGKLSAQCRPHIPVLEKLKVHGINDVIERENFKRGNVTDKRKQEVFERDDFVCCYCGKKCDSNDVVVDHVIPSSKGGTDNKDNLVAACSSCNSKKSDKSVQYFVDCLPDPISALKRLKERLPERVFNTLEDKDKEKEKDKDKEEVKVKEKDKDSWVVPENLDTPEIRSLLDQFAAMRQRTKKPIKDFANSSVILKRFDSAEHLAYALETCIANDYQGLKPDYRPPLNLSKPRTETTYEVAER